MSRYAVTPETYDAWRHLEVNKELRTYERDRAAVSRGKTELESLLAGTKISFPVTAVFLLTTADLKKSPTVEKVENFFKHALEFKCFTQRSLARSVERYHCRKICIADLQARPGEYPDFGTEEEVRQYAEGARRKDAKLAQLMAEIKEGQRHDAENENLLTALDTLIAERHACEQSDEIESDNDESEPDIIDE